MLGIARVTIVVGVEDEGAERRVRHATGGGMRCTTASSSSGTLVPSLAGDAEDPSGFARSAHAAPAPVGPARLREVDLVEHGDDLHPASIARNRLESVCAWIPCDASTTRIAPSHAWSERDTS